MEKVRKKADAGRTPFRRLSDSEILLFVTRTLRTNDADTADVFAKLRSLKDVLDQQDFILSEWSESSNKDRMSNTLVKAKDLVAQIADDLAGVAKADAAAGSAQSA